MSNYITKYAHGEHVIYLKAGYTRRGTIVVVSIFHDCREVKKETHHTISISYKMDNDDLVSESKILSTVLSQSSLKNQ